MNSKLIVAVLLVHAISIANAAGGGGSMSASAEEAQGKDTDYAKTIAQGLDMTLQCKNISETAVVQWLRDGILVDKEAKVKDDEGKDTEELKYKFTNKTMTIVKAMKETDVGNYSCVTTNLPPPQKYFNISVIFLTYRSMPKSLTHFQGDPFNITCDVEGNPPPIVTWTKDKKLVTQDMENRTFEFRYNSKNVENAVLEFSEAVDEDRGVYKCTINSRGIMVKTETMVRVKDIYAALWPFLGICAEVIILCLIIFIYEKKRSKNDLDESDTDQPNEKNPSGSNTDVRQRK